ncbi:unnamed protein product [Cyprideis torosa]|uniref:Uncharacterized protein n=1 Tax=Cyprideis torosa TaxID=163714 RepID=A0A7R8W7F2_9CRUS|nr:unnamed protein product [Cyprideis torosa]CAG0882380.1 unnamed protein product [Cyprideis torosa]
MSSEEMLCLSKQINRSTHRIARSHPDPTTSDRGTAESEERLTPDGNNKTDDEQGDESGAYVADGEQGDESGAYLGDDEQGDESGAYLGDDEQGDESGAYLGDDEQGDESAAYLADGEQGDESGAYLADGEQGDEPTAYLADGEQGDESGAYLADGEQGDESGAYLADGEQGDESAAYLADGMRRYAEFAEYGDDADYWGNLDETDNVAQAKTDYGSTNIFSSLLSEAMKYRGDAGSTLKQLASSINKILRNFFDEGDTRRSRAFEESGKLPNDLDGCPHGTCYYGKGTTTIMEGVPEIIQLVLQQILRLIGSTGQIGTACQYQLTPRHIEYSPYPNYYPSYPVYPAGYLGYFGYPGYFAYPGWYQKPLYPMLPHGIPKPIEAPVDEPTKRPCPPAAPGAGGHRKDEGSSTSDTNEALDYGVPSPPVLDLSIAFDFQFSANVPSKDSGIKELYQTSDSSTLQSFLDLLKDLKMSTMTDPKTINKLLMLSIDSLDTIVSSDSEAIDHLLSDESDALFVNLIRTVGSIVARSLNLQLAGGVPDFFYYHDHEGVSGAEIDPLLDREKILEEITKLANLAISANFSVKQKREILFEIKDLIEIFIESEGSDRRFLIIKEINGEMISQGHLLWVSFVQFQIGALLQSYGLEVQLSPEARSTPIELISNFLINENFVMGPYAFHERYCNAISLMGITPGQPTFNQDDFNNFWTAYWKFMNSKGKQLLHPCGKYVVSSLPQALPDPNHVHRVVCPLAQLSLLDNSLATFDPKNWDRFAFAYWSWILTGGTMKPQLCYIRPPSATGVFNFFPLPGVHVGKSGDITVTPQVSLVQQMFPFPGFHGFQPMSPLQYQLQPDEPLLPLQVLPDPYKFYQEHCPGIEIASVALRSSHYHQFMRNYFNCLFDDQKCAINCLVDESRFDQEHDHFLPILGMTLREE